MGEGGQLFIYLAGNNDGGDDGDDDDGIAVYYGVNTHDPQGKYGSGFRDIRYTAQSVPNSRHSPSKTDGP